MHRPAVFLAFLSALAPLAWGQAVPARDAGKPVPVPAVFQKYCVECHGHAKAKAHVNLEHLVAQSSVGLHADTWDKVIEMLETAQMPPSDADELPTDAERQTAAAWVRRALKDYETKHAGEPGRVTVRRLTSGEYAYAIRDLTGIDLKVGIDASSDSVGGEGFTNFGDVQFVQDASIERYLEAAKQVAGHAIIGAGPLQFYADPGKTGLELSALNRINELYATKGFRVVSGEGGRPFGLERYGKAFFVAWQFKHRAALGHPQATLRELAAKEGITGRFADHIWSVVNQSGLGYPSGEIVARWKALPAPTADTATAIAQAGASCDALYKHLTTWPSWFFARGDLAAGGEGDESPLVFDDSTLKAATTHAFTYALGFAGGRVRGMRPTAGPSTVHLRLANVNPSPGVKPVVIWRNPRVVTRAAPRIDPAAKEAVAGDVVAGRRRTLGPILSTQPLRALLSEAVGARLGFGASPDGSAIGSDDFATTETVSFQIDVPPGGNQLEFQAEAELGRDRNAVVRLVISDSPDGPTRNANQRAILADAESAGYATFRAGIAEYVALLPPNSHGEANPADKDPVPAPFDNTYNSPEHDAFVIEVKYQRTDAFFTDNMVDGADRQRLNDAWNDLFGSWPYHNAYLELLAEHYRVELRGRRIQDLSTSEIASLPAAMQPHVTSLRTHHNRVVEALANAQPRHVNDAIEFASQAWRRPLTVPEDGKLRAFYERARKEHGLAHDEAIRALLARILVSPGFLYRFEPVAVREERPLNDWELASRLSFFLWASIPDDELRRVATAGKLRDAATLAHQVRRMTTDPKARRLATEFFGQWLGFYHFDSYRGVDSSRFPEFTDEVKTAMYDEAVSTFEYLVQQQRPLKEMLWADYTFLNQPLAKFYGVDREITSKTAMEKIEGANAFNRGGALRLGSVLTTTSAPLRTSPVKRGDWILRRILGSPTPPPPGDAGSLPSDPKAFGGRTLREKLTEHKSNPSCANCHVRIDPLGFPLEGFDAVGRTRTTYPDGLDIDVTGELADKTMIIGADGLLRYLEGRETQVMKTLARKMLGYALGRTVLASDRPLVDEMVAAGGNATFADLAIRIVTSRQFRNRQGQDEEVQPSNE
jgi:mono/diheme cytochrome c family protein